VCSVMYVVFVLIAILITLPITSPGYYKKGNLPGALLCLALAVCAWLLGRQFPIVGGPIIAILLGLLVANIWPYPEKLKPGISATSKRVLQMAIVLLGFQMNLNSVLTLGGQGLLLIAATIATALLLAYGVGKALRMQSHEQILIGAGSAICGASAIAATAPVIKADERTVITAISTIFLFNIVAVFVYPFAGHLLDMSDLRFGLWCGAAINDTSSVVAAAYSYSDEAGYAATVVKLTRTLMIIPITLILAVIQTKKSGKDSGFSLRKIFPWFVAAFFAASVITSIGFIPAETTAFWGTMGKFCITMALAAIGLNTNARELIKHGKKPVLLGGICALAIALVSLLVQELSGII